MDLALLHAVLPARPLIAEILLAGATDTGTTIDLERPFNAAAPEDYDPVELARYALCVSDYWVAWACVGSKKPCPLRRYWRMFEWSGGIREGPSRPCSLAPGSA